MHWQVIKKDCKQKNKLTTVKKKEIEYTKVGHFL